jgi:hypothetical protein
VLTSAERTQGRAAGGLLEQVLGALVGEPAPPGARAEVPGAGAACRARAPLGEEERARVVAGNAWAMTGGAHGSITLGVGVMAAMIWVSGVCATRR